MATVMMPTTSYSSEVSYPIYSTPLPGAGYYGSVLPAHTVETLVDASCVGTVSFQATLLTNPTDLDWFTIPDSTMEYDGSGEKVTVTTFYGNYVFVRASASLDDGHIVRILYTHN